MLPVFQATELSAGWRYRTRDFPLRQLLGQELAQLFLIHILRHWLSSADAMYTPDYPHAPRTITAVDMGKRKVDDDTLLAAHAGRYYNKKSPSRELALRLTLTLPLASPMLPLYPYPCAS
jgi:hypothetical protein